MALQNELGYPNPIRTLAHEALLNIVVTAELAVKEGDVLLRPHHVTESQFNVLMLLAHQAPPEGAVQVQLGRMLVVNRSNVTGLIDRMEAAGWVERTHDPADRRVKLVRLTPAGRALVEKAEKDYMARVTRVLGVLTKAEQAQLCRMLEKVREGVREQGL